MSNQISKIIVFALSIFIAFSCNTQSDTKVAKTVVIAKIGYENYINVYKGANDTIKNWIKSKLASTKAYRVANWQLDSLICFNKKVNKCITCVYHQESITTNNTIVFFYGIKIKREWFFFEGPAVYIFSERYGFPPNTPLSFEKLHEIAMKQIYKGYLKPKGFLGLGGYEINEDFFRDIEVRDAYNYPFTTQESWEESWLRLMRENWAKKDTTVYRPDQ